MYNGSSCVFYFRYKKCNTQNVLHSAPYFRTTHKNIYYKHHEKRNNLSDALRSYPLQPRPRANNNILTLSVCDPIVTRRSFNYLSYDCEIVERNVSLFKNGFSVYFSSNNYTYTREEANSDTVVHSLDKNYYTIVLLGLKKSSQHIFILSELISDL